MKAFIDENPNLNHVLEQLRTISDILVQRKFDLADSLTTLSKFTASLGEAIASGPYFKVMLVNLLPYWILQPFVDAAFKKRGIDPENFWRGAGLPAFRWPDPNGTRFPNGAPPPAPTVLEGTPDYPGPGVLAGTPCSYTPAADTIPTAGDPLPCSHLSVGPFGNNPYGTNYGPPNVNVVTSPPNPNGPGYTPGVTSAGVPGETPPELQGVPVPIARRSSRARGPNRLGRCRIRTRRRPCHRLTCPARRRPRDQARRCADFPPPGVPYRPRTLEATDLCRRSSTSET